MSRYILALDQGTTSSRAIVFDEQANQVAKAQKDLRQNYPRPGWVEHDPIEVWGTQLQASNEVLLQAGIKASEIAGIGITNQRETTVVWDKNNGRPVCHAIVWQCRRTAPICEELKRKGWSSRIAEKTGLVIDAYFSGPKLAWVLDNVSEARSRAGRGELLFGTIDTWLLWNLSGGALHITDYSNASRTMLFNLNTLAWDDEILELLRIPRCMLPRVEVSSRVYGATALGIFDAPIPLAGIIGDQQAALFGQGCFKPGSAKCTYGTGGFLLMNTGNKPVSSKSGLLTTIAWGSNNGTPSPAIVYALEGSVFVAGAVIQWLRDELGIIATSAASEELACSVSDNGGVYLVPAFVGLGAPYWDMYARGAILGLTRGTGRGHLARAALEAIAYQTKDVLDAMQKDCGFALEILRADGGAAANRFLMQFQADILGIGVEIPTVSDTTALGAAFLAGLATGVYPDPAAAAKTRKVAVRYMPGMYRSEQERLLAGWKKAVESTRSFICDEVDDGSSTGSSN